MSAAGRSTATGSLSPSRSGLRKSSRQRATEAVARQRRSSVAEAAAAAAQSGTHARQGSLGQVLDAGDLARSKRLRRSRAARERSTTVVPEACAANESLRGQSSRHPGKEVSCCVMELLSVTTASVDLCVGDRALLRCGAAAAESRRLTTLHPGSWHFSCQ